MHETPFIMRSEPFRPTFPFSFSCWLQVGWHPEPNGIRATLKLLDAPGGSI